MNPRRPTPPRPHTPPQITVPSAPSRLPIRPGQLIPPLTTTEARVLLGVFFLGGLIAWPVALYSSPDKPRASAVSTAHAASAKPTHKQRDLPCAYYITFKTGEHYKSTFVDLDQYGRPTRAREKTGAKMIEAAKKQGFSHSDNWYSFSYRNDRLVESVWYAGKYTWTTAFIYDGRGRLTEWERTGQGKTASQEIFDRHSGLQPMHSSSPVLIGGREAAVLPFEYRYVLGQEGVAFWEKNGVVPGPEQSIFWGQTETWNAGVLSDNDLGRRYTYDGARIAKIESPTSGMIFHPLYGKQCTAHEAAFPALPR